MEKRDWFKYEENGKLGKMFPAFNDAEVLNFLDDILTENGEIKEEYLNKSYFRKIKKTITKPYGDKLTREWVEISDIGISFVYRTLAENKKL